MYGTRYFLHRTAGEAGLLRRLGLVGMDAVEPEMLASLATETRLLLIVPHGTAKSLLLCPLCEECGLSWRHYNASLIIYDDLVGYPPIFEKVARLLQVRLSMDWSASLQVQLVGRVPELPRLECDLPHDSSELAVCV